MQGQKKDRIGDGESILFSKFEVSKQGESCGGLTLVHWVIVTLGGAMRRGKQL